MSLVVGVVIGAVAWLTVMATFEPGFGFESLTVRAAAIGTLSAIAVAVGAVRLGRPPLISVLCLGAAVLLAGMIFAHS